MKRAIPVTTAIAVAVMLAGCGTIAGRQYPSLRAEPSSPYYPATIMDGYVILLGTAGLTSSGSRPDQIPSRTAGLVMIPLGVLDLPFSLVTDTLLLPADLVRQGRRPPKPTVPKHPPTEFTLSRTNAVNSEAGLRLLSFVDDGTILVQDFSSGKTLSLRQGDAVAGRDSPFPSFRVLTVSGAHGEVLFGTDHRK